MADPKSQQASDPHATEVPTTVLDHVVLVIGTQCDQLDAYGHPETAGRIREELQKLVSYPVKKGTR